MLLSVLQCKSSISQVASGYNFSTGTSTYTEITGGSTLTATDDAVYSVTLPFDFIFNGIQYTTANSIRVSTNGFITFGATAPASNVYTPISSTAGYSGAVSAMGQDLNTGTGPEIRYQNVSGVFIIQWKNFKRWGLNDVLNFQIKLYQSTNKIEIVFGTVSTSSNPASSYDFQVGLRGAGNSDFHNRTTNSNWNNAGAGGSNSAAGALNTSVTVPSTGRSYIWIPNGNNCSATEAVPIANPSALSGNLSVTTGSAFSDCQGTDTEDVFYSFRTTTAGTYSIIVVGSEAGSYSYPFNPVIELHADCTGSTLLACAGNNIRPADGTQTINYSCAANTTYYIRVFEYTANLSGVNPTFGINIVGTLPVQLVDFQVTCHKGTNQITWSTVTEINNNYFTIEKSFDAIDFKPLAEIQGNGNTNNLTNYQYTDMEPNPQMTTYYRLKQTDFDGNEELSEIKSVSCNLQYNMNNVNMFYFEKDEDIEMVFTNRGQEGDFVYSIYNISGIAIKSGKIYLGPGVTKQLFNVDDLAKGLYLFSLKKNGETINSKIILN